MAEYIMLHAFLWKPQNGCQSLLTPFLLKRFFLNSKIVANKWFTAQQWLSITSSYFPIRNSIVSVAFVFISITVYSPSLTCWIFQCRVLLSFNRSLQDMKSDPRHETAVRLVNGKVIVCRNGSASTRFISGARELESQSFQLNWDLQHIFIYFL